MTTKTTTASKATASKATASKASKATSKPSKAIAEASAKQAAKQADMAKQAALDLARENTCAPHNQIPDGKRWAISDRTGLKVQKLGAKINGALHKQFAGFYVGGLIQADTKDGLVIQLCKALHVEPTGAAIRSKKETISRLATSNIITPNDKGIWSLAILPSELV
jgi:hypothetical protein